MNATFAKRSKFRMLHLGRHGRSRVNLAQERAEDKHEPKFKISGPDRQQPITSLGKRQSFSQGAFLATLPANEQPTLFLSTSFLRTEQSLDRAIIGGNFDPAKIRRDSHRSLRDRELGDKYGYTTASDFFHAHPSERARRQELGKLYYGYPNGESYQCLIERVSCALTDVEAAYGEDHEVAFIEGHNSTVRACVTVYCGLSERDFESLADKDVPNGSITTLARNEATGLMEIVRKLYVPEPISKSQYRQFRKKQKSDGDEK